MGDNVFFGELSVEERAVLSEARFQGCIIEYLDDFGNWCRELSFGGLSVEERAVLFEAMFQGCIIEYLDDFGKWNQCSKTGNFRGDLCYRLAPIKPSVNWDHVRESLNALATDSDGESYLYESAPTKNSTTWAWSAKKREIAYSVDALKSFKRGACDWSDSLLLRPGYEETE